MKRRTRAVPFARTRIESALRNLGAQAVAEWPKHLRLGWKILSCELAVDDEKARAVLLASLSAAHNCAQAINRRSRTNVYASGRKKLHDVFARIARCIRRSPASLRHVLDRDVCLSVRSRGIDLESMEALIDRLIAGFALLPKEEPSLTVLRALFPRVLLPKSKRADVLRRRLAQGAIFLKNDYAALPSIYQRRVETTLTRLRGRRAQFDAADVCEAIANALDGNEERTANTLIADLITNYVSSVALIWLRHGIRPSRAVHPSNPNYRSKFHRFVDLVLTAVLEPWSKRHDGDDLETLAKLRKAHARLPKDIRRVVRVSRSDVEWLVSDGHLKRAL